MQHEISSWKVEDDHLLRCEESSLSKELDVSIKVWLTKTTREERRQIIDEVFDISLKEVDGEPGMFFNNKSLIQFLKDWQAMKELLASGSQTADNYEIWKTIRPSVTKVVHED